MILLRSVFIFAIVAVAMIGVMVPSVFAEDEESEKLFPQYFTMSEDEENVVVSNRGHHVGTVSLQNVEVIDKEHYNLIKTSVKIKIKMDLQEFVKIYYKAIAIVSEKGIYEAEISPECKSPKDYNGLRDDRFFHVSGKMGGEFIIESCFSVEKHYEEFDIYYANFTPKTTGEYLEKTGKAAQIYHMDSFSLNDSNLISTDIFSDLTDTIISESSKVISESSDTIISESSKVISEYSKDSDIVIKQNIESVKGGGCLIATATYGSELAPQVQQLRELRDNQLLNTESGTQFMGAFNDIYYSFSPIIADYERENPYFKEAVKLAITPMISSLSLMENAESESEVLGIGISVIMLNLGMYFGVPAVVIVGIRKIK
jgi:hypothetical protein